MISRTIVVCTWVVAASATLVVAQERPQYRDFQFGSELATIVKQTGAFATDVKEIHRRPALIQALEFRPRYSEAETPRTDPVEQMTFGFYDDQLFRVVVDYDPTRTEGLTEADMIEGISSTYGPPATATTRKALPTSTYLEGGADRMIARWAATDVSVTLLSGSYPARFRLIVASTRLESLARTAVAAAVRQDAREAPQRELARLKKEADDLRATREKARLANKAAFKP